MAAEAIYRLLLGVLEESIKRERPDAYRNASALGSRLIWYITRHPGIWARFFRGFDPPERSVLAALFDVELGVDWVWVIDGAMAPASDHRQILGHLQSLPVAVFATFERLEDLTKIAQRRGFISADDEHELLDEVKDARADLDNPKLRHQTAHSSAGRGDAWLKAIGTEALWELLVFGDREDGQIDPVMWFQGSAAGSVPHEEWLALSARLTRELDEAVGRILVDLHGRIERASSRSQ